MREIDKEREVGEDRGGRREEEEEKE